MPWVNTTRKNVANSSAVASLNVTLNSTVAGNHIIVGTSAWGNPAGPTSVVVSDAANGAYTSSFYKLQALGLQAVTLHYKENGVGGNLTITSNPSGASADANDMAIFAHEFSGGATSSSASGTPSTNEGSSTTASTGSTTPADADCLLIAVTGYDGSGTITGNAGGEGFTLSNQVPGGSPQPGDMEFKILTGGSGVGQSESWTFGASGPWAAGISAFKPLATAFLQRLALMGVGS